MVPKHWEAIESPSELAERLWTFEALELAPSQFRRLAQRVWTETRNATAMWKLGGAIHDYLRHRPGSVPVPAHLPWLLLKSRQCDARVVGLKLLRHVKLDDQTLLAEVLTALDRRRNYERCGGIHELEMFLDRLGKRRLAAKRRTTRKVEQRLQELSVKMPDGEREFAAAILERFQLATARQ
jgi:hypothetical protein